MGKASNALMRLDSGMGTNWKIDAQPVAILNEASTQHERIAYCWSLARDLLELSSVLLEHQSPEVARTACMFYNQATLLVAVLERLGSDTYSDEKAKAQQGGAA